MSIFNYFLKKEKKSSASLAKERLQIIVAHERSKRQQPDYLPLMQKEIMDVIRKYVNIDEEQVIVQLDNNEDCSVLELNITLPE
ncbi:cell division topological specificity factor MinE [Paraglaciecola sp. T6c]|uniref:Cell division topological specificity factor n=1 Tax=Pseudoalteromonas atlantica (strain T6c / ATCC BAA-1087) TaxID=3042615 RepID=MINE_PSEA6|nr:cell division topological specificity factor MinE [Paraglaciecola sp. T6c]Q15XD5.1 RecName: Full=Cell division topological specificity factor [Paraglaciecola sp. T6c]ABG39453.1 cell division topological specificity factor MinE [Paraglaciecola sp. T6c]